MTKKISKVKKNTKVKRVNKKRKQNLPREQYVGSIDPYEQRLTIPDDCYWSRW